MNQYNAIKFNNAFSNINNVSDIDFMDGHSFEYFCAYILEKNGFSDVSVTKGSGDQGVDVLASKSGIRYAIQCKNYASPLSNTPIQEVYAGKTYYNCHVGVVMTNSTFTTSAVELANSTGVLIWDRLELHKMICNSQDKQPRKVVVKKRTIENEKAAFIKQDSNEFKMDTNIHKSNSNNKNVRLRKSMKIWAIICFVFSAIYILMAFTELFMIAGTPFFALLGMMFFVLAFTPKESKYILGKDKGLKKKTFVIIVVTIAFIFFGIIANYLQ